MWEPRKRRIILEQDLLNAVKRGEIYVAYQPIVHPSTNKIGFEALARWNSPIHGHVPPAEFILMAEKMDIIQEITYFIIETVSTQLRDMPQIDILL